MPARAVGQYLTIVVLCVCLMWPAVAWSTRQQEEPEPEAASEGEVLLERWQPEAARQWAEKRLASEPEHPVWRFVLGQALFELFDTDTVHLLNDDKYSAG